jgi:hypothetical protein
MSSCKFEIYFDEYIRGELDAQMDISFHSHLETCDICRQKLDEYYPIHHIVNTRQRPEVEPEVLKSYHKSLKTGLLINAPVQKLSSLIDNLIYTRSPWIRFAEAAVVLVVGIFIGTMLLSGPEKQRTIPILQPEQFAQPVSRVETEFMSYYFGASEIILLELMNSDSDAAGIFMDKEVGQKLLMKTFLVHEIALRLNEPEVLRFLGLMEVILYDISNMTPNEIDETLKFVRSLIEEKKLLQTIQDLQKRLKNSGSPQNMPG